MIGHNRALDMLLTLNLIDELKLTLDNHFYPASNCLRIAMDVMIKIRTGDSSTVEFIQWIKR